MTDQPKGDKSAVTVVIQSWWTPALALIMLMVGLAAGYLGRPLLTKEAQPTQPVAAIATTVSTVASNLPAVPTNTVNPTMAAIGSQAQLMDYLVSNTTHFQGDANAKVTIIEFSDYQ